VHAHSQNGRINIDELSREYNKLSSHYLAGITPIENTFYPNRFTHLMPYGGKYSAYLVARASAALVWHRIFENDPFCVKAGE
jgi:hypothetical protein